MGGAGVSAASSPWKRYGWLRLFVALSLPLGANTASQAQTKPAPKIDTEVELVQIPVIVFDEKGGVATNLKKEDFRIFEDGVEQRILYCEREREPAG